MPVFWPRPQRFIDSWVASSPISPRRRQERVADPVEVRVGRDRQRVLEVDRPVAGGAGVLGVAVRLVGRERQVAGAAVGVLPGVVVDEVRRDEAVVEPGVGAEQLEGRARGVLAGDGPVEQRVVVLLPSLVGRDGLVVATARCRR